MLKVFTAQQIKALDAFSIQHEPIASIDLMERACQAFVEWLAERIDTSKKIGIVCGTGNNGGDGLGIARILHDWGYLVKIWIIHGSVKEKEDFKTNLSRLPEKLEVMDFPTSPPADIFLSYEVLIDAIFGSGLSRSAEGIYAKAIEAVNAAPALRIAVDIPSGLFADKHSSGFVVSATYTVTFQLPKLAFMMPENNSFVGEWHVVDIGLDKSFIQNTDTLFYCLDKKSIKKILKTRLVFSHKGDYGKALMIAGSYGKMGACVLASRAALRAGLGLLTVHIPKSGYSILQATVPEAMVSVYHEDEIFTDSVSLDPFDIIGVGPGIGQAKETTAALKTLLTSGKPLILDADALNILSANLEMLAVIPEGSILTPHPKEFERLTGKWKDDFERLEKQIKLAMELKSVIILKGARTSIASPTGAVYFNSTGNAGMATGGSGDVLTGILTGIMAQKYSPLETAILGVFLHGMSGDLAVREKGMNSLIASDLIDFLPEAFNSVSR